MTHGTTSKENVWYQRSGRNTRSRSKIIELVLSEWDSLPISMHKLPFSGKNHMCNHLLTYPHCTRISPSAISKSLENQKISETHLFLTPPNLWTNSERKIHPPVLRAPGTSVFIPRKILQSVSPQKDPRGWWWKLHLWKWTNLFINLGHESPGLMEKTFWGQKPTSWSCPDTSQINGIWIYHQEFRSVPKMEDLLNLLWGNSLTYAVAIQLI